MIGITTDKHDAYLSEVVPILIEYASDFCKNNFEPGTLPAGVKILLQKRLNTI
nr:hypothetical protein P5658_25325 [Bacillus subtilis]